SAPLSQGGSQADSIPLVKGVAMFGGFTGTESLVTQRNPGINQTILSGDLERDDVGALNDSDNAFHVLHAIGPAMSGTLDGFTIRGGRAVGPAIDLDDHAGALLIEGGAVVTVRDCRLTNHRASANGGAVSILAGSTGLFDRCEFSDLRADSIGGAAHIATGQLALPSLFKGCTFTGCQTVFGAFDTPTGLGGALGFIDAQANLVSCTFTRNRARDGGAVYIQQFSEGWEPAEVVSSTFNGNFSSTRGGAISHQFSSQVLHLTNSSFVGNQNFVLFGPGEGGMALWARNAGVVIKSCSIVANVGSPSGDGLNAAFFIYNDNGFLHNSIAYDNNQIPSAPPEATRFLQVTLSGALHSIIMGDPAGVDPQFIRNPSPGLDTVWGTTDDDYGDLRLQQTSPAVDAGNAIVTPLDTFDVDRDSNLTEQLPTDVAGLPRFVDDPGVSDTGPGDSPHIDMGAFERQVNCPTCPGPREWINPAGGSSSQFANWSPSLPTSAQDTLFALPASTYTVTFPGPGPATTYRSAAIRNGDVSFNLAGGNLNLNALQSTALVVGDQPALAPSLTVFGVGTLQTTNTVIAADSESQGSLTISGLGTRLNASNSLVVGAVGNGELLIENGARAATVICQVGQTAGSFGTLRVAGAGSRLDVGGVMLINNGHVTIHNGGTLNAFPGQVLIGENGLLDGNGTINGTVLNFGDVQPGNTPGTLTIRGGFIQASSDPELGAASGTLTMEIDGLNPGQFDRLVVQGPVQLGGGLIVQSPVGGFPAPPAEGLSLPIIDALGGIATSETTGLPADRFDVAFFPRVPGAGGGASDKFLKLERPEGGGAAFFNLTTGSLGAPITINGPANTSASSTPSAVVPADLEGDGLDDLALATPGSNSVVILMNRGSMGGDWQGFEGAVQYGVG
ncbi:MAG: right-handed parallel beta-helix repeat-containing protein, partial [Phycisphaerales bacterium]